MTGSLFPLGSPKRIQALRYFYFNKKVQAFKFVDDDDDLLHDSITIIYRFVLQGDLLYNEYIVYNVEQIRMRYVVNVKFNFRKRS